MQTVKVIYLEDDMEMFEAVEALLPKPEWELLRLPHQEESLSQIEALNPDIVLVENRLHIAGIMICFLQWMKWKVSVKLPKSASLPEIKTTNCFGRLEASSGITSLIHLSKKN